MSFLNKSYDFTCVVNQGPTKFPIYEYTLGNKHSDWISGSMRLDLIENETLNRSKESDTNTGPRKNRLVIAARDEGGVARVSNYRMDSLRIYIHHINSANKAVSMIEFEKPKFVSPPELVRVLLFIPLPMPIRLFTFEYLSDATVHRLL
jgi:hypothetical protein